MSKGKLQYINKTPTEAEKMMYDNGFFLVSKKGTYSPKKEETAYKYIYAASPLVSPESTVEKVILTETVKEFERKVIFDTSFKTIEVVGDTTPKLIYILARRAKELGY